MKTRYAVTHLNQSNMRTLSCPNQGRNHFDTPEAAKDWMDAVHKNTPVDTLAQVYGAQAIGTFEVRPVECYDHGDAIGIYFDDPAIDPKPYNVVFNGRKLGAIGTFGQIHLQLRLQFAKGESWIESLKLFEAIQKAGYESSGIYSVTLKD